MRRDLTIFAATAVWIATAVACATPPLPAQQADVRGGYMDCTEPRPEICTMQYDPVCGQISDGRSKTYSNACSACSDSQVHGHTLGPCLPTRTE